MAVEDDEEKHDWLVIFKEGQSPISYKDRTPSQMIDVAAKYLNRHKTYPFRIWLFEDKKMQRVEIAS